MTTWHSDLHKRKKSGGKRIPSRDKRRYERGGDPILPVVGERSVKMKRTRGGGVKIAVKSDKYANVYDPSTGKAVRADIITVKANPASRDFERRGVMTRGAIIETSVGEARVSSKPSSDGVINAILIKPRQ